MTKVTVYTKPNCVNCEDTKNLMNEKNINYETVDIIENPEARNMLKAKGYRVMPVVITDNDAWTGFDEKKILSILSNDSKNADDDDIWA